MPSIHGPAEVTPEMREAKRDYLDRHTPHVVAPSRVKKGQPFDVTVKMGRDYVHPDLPEHYIQALQLWKGDRLLATATYAPGAATAGKDPASGFARATFAIALDGPGRLTAVSYCTVHGVWSSEEVAVEVDAD